MNCASLPKYDIFISGADKHICQLQNLMPSLKGCGTVHLVSSFLSPENIEKLQGLYDVIHEPALSDDGYMNFKLFNLYEINRFISQPWFIKIDADVQLSNDWLTYVDGAIREDSELVFFGPRKGNPLKWEISGEAVRAIFDQDISILGEEKIVGGFYCGKSSFFQENEKKLRVLTEFIYCFKDGEKVRPTPTLDDIFSNTKVEFELGSVCQSRQAKLSEDNLKNLIVRVCGSKNMVRVIPDTRITIPRATGNKDKKPKPYFNNTFLEKIRRKYFHNYLR